MDAWPTERALKLRICGPVGPRAQVSEYLGGATPAPSTLGKRCAAEPQGDQIFEVRSIEML
jgi:hypothetical protein